jgi:predicted nucleic acid-binding protein
VPASKPRVYLDVCCLNRPFDDQTQHRIRIETAAIVTVLSLAEQGMVEWYSNSAVDAEVAMNSDPLRRGRVQVMARAAHGRIPMGDDHRLRASVLHGHGLAPMDALHVAMAESADAVLLTTDDRLVRGCESLGVQVSTRVCNPVPWVEEALRQWPPTT